MPKTPELWGTRTTEAVNAGENWTGQGGSKVAADPQMTTTEGGTSLCSGRKPLALEVSPRVPHQLSGVQPPGRTRHRLLSLPAGIPH